MSGRISRGVCKRFLLLYPEPFRQEFGDEILDIVEECRRAPGSWRVFADVLFSGIKQRIHHILILQGLIQQRETVPGRLDIERAPNLARILGVSVCGAALITGVLGGRRPETSEPWMVVRPEALFYFRSFRRGEIAPVRLSLGANQSAFSPEYWTVVRSKSRFWISTVPWGQYCLAAPERKD